MNTALLAACGLIAAAAATAAAERPTILCIGDSITAGGRGFPVYRWFLAHMLEEAGTPCTFIGPHRDRAGGHFGNGGRSTAWLREHCEGVYRKFPADIVLIHSGHNGSSRDKPVAGMLRDTEAMIRAIHAINPGVRILLARVIESGKLPKYAYIPEFNRQLPGLSTRLGREGIPVATVDVAGDFDWRTDTLEDKVHPNEAGARKMARVWFRALQHHLTGQKAP